VNKVIALLITNYTSVLIIRFLIETVAWCCLFCVYRVWLSNYVVLCVGRSCVFGNCCRYKTKNRLRLLVSHRYRLVRSSTKLTYKFIQNDVVVLFSLLI
jgi:hypothetical protein